MVQFVKKTIGELFHFESSNAIYHAINVTVHGKRETNSFPYVVRSSVHNGIKGYIVEPKNGLNSGNTISLAQDTGEFFYQEKSYFTGNKVKVLMPIGFELTKCCALYLMTAMQKAFYAFTWGSSFNTDVMKKVEVVVPVTDSGQLDVQYMEQYIKRIEAQYIKRIEAYLSVLGYGSIADCELSSQDLKVLSGPDEWGEFSWNDVRTFDSHYFAVALGRSFHRQKIMLETVLGHSVDDVSNEEIRSEIKSKLTDLQRFDSNSVVRGKRVRSMDRIPGKIPFVTAGVENQGISSYVSDQQSNTKYCYPGTITIDMFGNVFFRDYKFAADDHVTCLQTLNSVFDCDKKDDPAGYRWQLHVKLYLATAIQKAIPSGAFTYAKNFYPRDVQCVKIKLPVTPDGKPDYDFMDQYITAIEKKKVLKLKQAMDHKLELYWAVSHQN